MPACSAQGRDTKAPAKPYGDPSINAPIGGAARDSQEDAGARVEETLLPAYTPDKD